MRDYLGFFTLVTLILLSLFCVWFGLKSYGLSQPVNNYQTPLVQELVKRDGTLWSKDSESFKWLQIEFENGLWKAKGDTIDLAEKLDKIDLSQKILLFFEIKSSKALPSLREIMLKNDQWKRSIFCSRHDGPLKDLRDLEPQWTYCSGEVFLTRVLAFSSLGLESMLDISADVVFIHLDNLNPTPTFHRVIKEAKRQNKLVIMGPLTRPLESFNPHGWLVEKQP